MAQVILQEIHTILLQHRREQTESFSHGHTVGIRNVNWALCNCHCGPIRNNQILSMLYSWTYLSRNILLKVSFPRQVCPSCYCEILLQICEAAYDTHMKTVKTIVCRILIKGSWKQARLKWKGNLASRTQMKNYSVD